MFGKINQELAALIRDKKRAGVLIFSFLGLLLVYMAQDYLSVTYLGFENINPVVQFIAKKYFRVILNDVFLLLLIHAWFNDARITRLALILQLIDTFLLLPGYLILKLTMEGTSEFSSPLLSQLHRVIINPTLMILLIPAVYFQRFQENKT